MDALQEKLRYRFRDESLLRTALTHSSYANEHRCASNERLEFVGDSVLGFVTATWLYRNYPALPEGKMTPPARGARLRAEPLGDGGRAWLWRVSAPRQGRGALRRPHAPLHPRRLRGGGHRRHVSRRRHGPRQGVYQHPHSLTPCGRNAARSGLQDRASGARAADAGTQCQLCDDRRERTGPSQAFQPPPRSSRARPSAPARAGRKKKPSRWQPKPRSVCFGNKKCEWDP